MLAERGIDVSYEWVQRWAQLAMLLLLIGTYARKKAPAEGTPQRADVAAHGEWR
jgi:hypothetical protein